MVGDPPRAGGGYFPRAGQTRTSLQLREPRHPRLRPGLGHEAPLPSERKHHSGRRALSVSVQTGGEARCELPSAGSPSHRQYHEDRMDGWAETGDRWQDETLSGSTWGRRQCMHHVGGGGGVSACRHQGGGESSACRASIPSHPSLIDFFEWCARMDCRSGGLPATSGGTS